MTVRVSFCSPLRLPPASRSAPALADPPRDPDRAFAGDARQGRSLPLPRDRAARACRRWAARDYLGPELERRHLSLKFLRNGRVIWVDVDGQGRIIRRSRDH